ncbi:MAG: DinB family protein [Anaerolineae bacterium]|nr:DinB family protein [Anaerolineae bacterium]MCB0243942.1 DinB family protein [Anaerolineae bacterium]HRX03772.1 DinB family protein [Anaerolineae bacterium]
MTDFPNRHQLFEELINARQELNRSLLYLTSEETRQPGIHAQWCVRDVMSHVTGREAAFFAAVRNLANDGDPCFPDPLDERQFNLAAIERRSDFSMAEVMDELDSLRQQIMKYLRKLPNQALFGAYEVRASGEWQSIADVLNATIAHDRVHADGIWQWRAAAGLLHWDQFRHQIARERHEFLNAIGGMHESEMISIETCGYWTVRDLMAHVLSWDEEIYRTVKHWTGDRSWQDGALYDDEWNEREVTQRAKLDVIDLADGLATWHRRILQFCDLQAPAALVAAARAPWGEPMSMLSLLYEMAAHDAVHRADIEAMRGAKPRGRSR